ncbi:MAG: radical SAM protein [Deltaproteobacteria bacterium]|nr:radical SAM protein [Deltaproteobacteria bacterium]
MKHKRLHQDQVALSQTPESAQRPRQPALRVDMKLGFSCNNRCQFCVQGDKRRRYADLSTEEAKKRIDQAAAHTDRIVLTGGEVTIRADLVDLVSHARKRGFREIQIQTNGRMLAYEALCHNLVAAGATEFSPALHGHIASLHDFLTRVPGSFDQTVQGIKNLASLKVPIVTNTVITRSNFRHLAALASLLIDLGVTQYQFAFVHGLGSAAKYFDSIVPRMELLAPHIAAGLEKGRQAGVWATTEAIPPCLLKGYEEHMAEWVVPDTRIYDADMILDSYQEYRWTEGKTKGPACRSCGWYPWCEGPWREYPERFGWSEFRSVAPKDVRRSIAEARRRAPSRVETLPTTPKPVVAPTPDR